jgi:outer membrane protein assembly factor BamB
MIKKTFAIEIILLLIFTTVPPMVVGFDTKPVETLTQNVDYQMDSPWPMFRHDLKHTGLTQYTGPPTSTMAWNYTTSDGIVSSAAIASDGTIYVGVGWNLSKVEDPHLYALNPNGSLKWKYMAPDGFFSSPSIGTEGTIYISCLDDSLYAIEDMATYGKLKWKKNLDSFFNLCSPAVWTDGTIHIGSPSYKYYKINPDGSFKWSYDTGWCIISSPAIDEDGIVYIGSKDHYLYAFEADENKLKWKFPTGKFYDGHLVDSSPAIGPDGTIYVGTDPYGAAGQKPIIVETNFWAVTPNGTLKWVFETEDGVESSPAIGPDGTIYFGSYDGYLYAVTDNGDKGILKWKFKTDGPIDGSPIVDGDGIIYFGSRDSILYALYPNGTVKWMFKAKDGFESSPSIDGNGYLYIGSFDGNLYCIGTGQPDVGVDSINTPSHIETGILLTPSATIRNYRAMKQSFNFTCIIDVNGTIVYSKKTMVNLSGGSSKQYDFSPLLISPDLGIEYTITVTTFHPFDENAENNKLSHKFVTSISIPPDKPKINGTINGKAGEEYEYIFVTKDPNGDYVYYYIDWGDNNCSGWIGPYPSGQKIVINHIWSEQETYIIKVKAKDIHDAESDWTILEVTMPQNKMFFRYPLFLKFINDQPNMLAIIRQLIGK